MRIWRPLRPRAPLRPAGAAFRALGPPAKACPPPPAEISGIITPAEIVGPAGQGIDAMSFAEIVAAIADGTAYANVHSSKWQGGEIRGQLK